MRKHAVDTPGQGLEHAAGVADDAAGDQGLEHGRRRLQWPPTPYGELVYTILLSAVQAKVIKQKDASDLVAAWFDMAGEA